VLGWEVAVGDVLGCDVEVDVEVEVAVALALAVEDPLGDALGVELDPPRSQICESGSGSGQDPDEEVDVDVAVEVAVDVAVGVELDPPRSQICESGSGNGQEGSAPGTAGRAAADGEELGAACAVRMPAPATPTALATSADSAIAAR
jgi:hypothetical protein